DDETLARSLSRVGRRLQGRGAPGLEFRLRRPAHGGRAAGRARAEITGPAAGVGQREPEGQERSSVESLRAGRLPQGLDAVRPGAGAERDFATWHSNGGRCHAEPRPTMDARLPGPDTAGVVAARGLLRPGAHPARLAEEPGGGKAPSPLTPLPRGARGKG